MDVVTYASGAVTVDRVIAALQDAGFEVGRFRTVTRSLLDTFDGRLHAAGMTLELREDPALTLVARGAGPAVAHAAVDRVPRVTGDLPAGPLRARLGPIVDVRALLPMMRVTASVASAVQRNKTGKAVLTVEVHDQLSGASGELSTRWAAEVLPFEGYPQAARAGADLLGSLGLAPREGGVLDLAAGDAGVDLRGFAGSLTVALDRSEPAIAGFRRVLVNLADTIGANRQGTVDDVDPEFLHDVRIAVRRTRSVLSHGRQVLPAEARDRFGAAFRDVQVVTGPPRDFDVYVMEWPGYVAPLDREDADALTPVLAHIERRRAQEQAQMAERLGSSEFDGLMAEWRGWLDGRDAEDLPKQSSRSLGTVVAGRLSKAQDRLLVRGRAIGPETAAEELHELRKDAKRLRYLLECFGGVFPTTTRKRFVQRLKALQDNLGVYQDAGVHSTLLRAMTAEMGESPDLSTDTLLAMGRLIELFEQRRQTARDQFAERFAAYDTKQTTRGLREMVEHATSHPR